MRHLFYIGAAHSRTQKQEGCDSWLPRAIQNVLDFDLMQALFDLYSILTTRPIFAQHWLAQLLASIQARSRHWPN